MLLVQMLSEVRQVGVAVGVNILVIILGLLFIAKSFRGAYLIMGGS